MRAIKDAADVLVDCRQKVANMLPLVTKALENVRKCNLGTLSENEFLHTLEYKSKVQRKLETFIALLEKAVSEEEIRKATGVPEE